MVCGDLVVLVAQDYSHEVIRDMPGLQSGLVLQSSSTHEGLPAVLVQVCVLSLTYLVINIISLPDRLPHARRECQIRDTLQHDRFSPCGDRYAR